MKNEKKQKLFYLTEATIKKLETIAKINGLDNSKTLEILINKQKKLQLF